MQMIKVLAILFTFLALRAYGQDPGSFLKLNKSNSDEEAAFYAETKQINQFFRRFNGEEDVRGVRFSNTDPSFRSMELRKSYINMLFDQQNINLPDLLKEAFVNDVLKKDAPKYLDFHAGEWFGEVNVLFQRGRDRVIVTLFMVLVKENLGSK
jgi:hypothetical protein